MPSAQETVPPVAEPGDPELLLSIVIPTDGRRPVQLAAAIDSALAQQLSPRSRYEIVVVDNTAGGRVYEAFTTLAAPVLRWVHASPPGVAAARNAGVAAAGGHYVAFLDDDEVAPPRWAGALLRHAKRGATAVFGPVEPAFEIVPVTCVAAARQLFSRDLNVTDGADVTRRHASLGTGNSLFHKATCFTAREPFASELNGLGGEDSDFLASLVRRGVRLTWAADAWVSEHVPAERVSFAALAQRRFRNGQVRALVAFRADGIAKLKGLGWMAAGSVQAIVYGLASLGFARVQPETARQYRLAVAGGAGKVLWMPRYWTVNYGAAIVGAPAEAPAPSIADNPLVSIVVVNYRTRELTLACLRSVLRETKRVRYEVLLVDNASGDGLIAAAAEEFPNVRLIPLPENIGFARANNLAAKEAKGDLLLLLNPDTVVLDGAIDRLVAFARRRPQARIWGGRTLYGDGSLNPTSCWQRMTLWNVLCRSLGLAALFPASPIFNAEGYGGWDRATEREVDIVTGCFLLIGRELWQRLDGFDDRFFMYGEEADLCLRAARLGARPAVTPDATIVHYGGASEQAESEKTIRLLAAKAELIKRHWRSPQRQIGLALFALWPLTRAMLAAVTAFASGEESRRSRADTWRRVWQDRARWRLGYR